MFLQTQEDLNLLGSLMRLSSEPWTDLRHWSVSQLINNPDHLEEQPGASGASLSETSVEKKSKKIEEGRTELEAEGGTFSIHNEAGSPGRSGSVESSRTVASLICVPAGLHCDLSVDGIGTCWPRSAAGELISRPCPEQFNGIYYNTTSKYHSTTDHHLVQVLLLGFWSQGEFLGNRVRGAVLRSNGRLLAGSGFLFVCLF